MKKIVKITGLLLLVCILFRGIIYRNLISYTSVGTRGNITITDEKLLAKIGDYSSNETIDIEEIIRIARVVTTEELSFSKNQISRNPNNLVNTHKANCIGYAALFNSIANHLIRTHRLEKKYEVKHRIGRLSFLGYNLHQLFDDPFFRDHDFNEIITLSYTSFRSIDPSLSDYLGIDYITTSFLEVKPAFQPD